MALPPSRSCSGSELSLRVGRSDDEPDVEVKVHIELVSMDSDHDICFDVDDEATIGQVLARFKQAALIKFKSNSFFESYKNGTIVLISPGSLPRSFSLSESNAYTRLLNTKEVRAFRCAHVNAPLLFQLVRNPCRVHRSESTVV